MCGTVQGRDIIVMHHSDTDMTDYDHMFDVTLALQRVSDNVVLRNERAF